MHIYHQGDVSRFHYDLSWRSKMICFLHAHNHSCWMRK